MSTATIMTTTIASAIQRAVRAFSDGSGSGVNGSSSLGGKTWSLSSPSTTIESCRSSTSCCSSVIGVSFLVLASRQTREDRLGHATVGRVDHLAVETRDAVDAEDAPRTVDLRVGRRVDLVADRDLRGVDAPLPLVAETARAQSRRAQSARVVEHGERPVDGGDAERAGGDRDAEERVLDVRALADRQLRDTERRGEVAGAEDECLEAARSGDPLALDEAERRLDLRLRGHRHPFGLLTRLDLRQHDDVRPHRAHELEVLPRAAVDADRNGRRAPFEIPEGARDRLPRFVLALRRDRVFEVEDHLVHREPRGLGELPLVVARHGQTAAAEASAHVAKLTISVRARHGTAKRRSEARFMRYLAAIIGLLGTLVLLAPVH